MYKNLKKVAIVGRPNVGKSTLFNRIIQKRVSITSDIEGVTRDRLYHITEWLGKEFVMVDTGGFTNSDKDFQKEINKQVDLAIDQADVIIFLTSIPEEPHPDDRRIASKLQKTNKNVILAVNKADNKELFDSAVNFYQLGFKSVIPISSIHGIGISDLLDEVTKDFSQPSQETEELTRIGIIGKPNVGKSTLVNKILNDERTIVSSIAGTTRDSIDTFVKINNKDYILTDTAGLKKNKKSLDDIEWYSELRTELTIMNSDITILLLDPKQGLTRIDEKITGILVGEYKPTFIAINKIDDVSMADRNEIIDKIKEKLKFAPWIPVISISALEGKNISKLYQMIEQIDKRRKINVSKSALNEFLMDIQIIKKPPRYNGIDVKLNYITYSNINFPHFIIFSNHPDKVHFSYQRFIENQIRGIFNLDGIPIKISLRGKK